MLNVYKNGLKKIILALLVKKQHSNYFYVGRTEAYVNNTRHEDEWMDKWKSNIYCNDCEKKGEIKYHSAYHKCQECNSWNTELNEIIKPNK